VGAGRGQAGLARRREQLHGEARHPHEPAAGMLLLDHHLLRPHLRVVEHDDGRLVYLTPELASMLSAQVDRVKALERKLDRVIPYL
jgi:hypothetical protein